MSSPAEPAHKRASYCEVMRCLHVDCAPQVFQLVYVCAIILFAFFPLALHCTALKIVFWRRLLAPRRLQCPSLAPVTTCWEGTSTLPLVPTTQSCTSG